MHLIMSTSSCDVNTQMRQTRVCIKPHETINNLHSTMINLAQSETSPGDQQCGFQGCFSLKRRRLASFFCPANEGRSFSPLQQLYLSNVANLMFAMEYRRPYYVMTETSLTPLTPHTRGP